jgi:hypothetical protein
MRHGAVRAGAQRMALMAVLVLALAGICAVTGLAAPTASALSGDEVASLRYARKQEKLARDVYRA